MVATVRYQSTLHRLVAERDAADAAAANAKDGPTPAEDAPMPPSPDAKEAAAQEADVPPSAATEGGVPCVQRLSLFLNTGQVGG